MDDAASAAKAAIDERIKKLRPMSAWRRALINFLGGWNDADLISELLKIGEAIDPPAKG